MSSEDEARAVLQADAVIDALAEPSRRHILWVLHKFKDKGVTAAELARHIGKSIPTVLHHLEVLEEAGLIESKMKEHETLHRDIKHWFVVHDKIHVKVPLELFSWLYIPLQKRWLQYVTESMKKYGMTFRYRDLLATSEEDLVLVLNITREQARMMRMYLTPQKAIEIIAIKLDEKFIEARNNHVYLEMSEADIAREHVLSEEEADVFQEIMRTREFQVLQEHPALEGQFSLRIVSDEDLSIARKIINYLLQQFKGKYRVEDGILRLRT